MQYTEEDKGRLAEYIKKQTKSGYDITSIRNFLISNGYSSSLVDASIDSVYGRADLQKEKLPRTYSKKLIIMSFIALVIVAGLVFGLFKLLDEDSAEIGILTERKPLGSQNVLANDGGEKEIIGRQNIDDSSVQQTTAEDSVIESGEQNREGRERAFIVYEPTILEIDDFINQKSEEESLNLCSELKEQQFKRNTCFKKMSIKFDSPEYCEKIDNINYRDNCYFIFAFAGKPQYCEKIQDTYQKLTCNSYGKASAGDGL